MRSVAACAVPRYFETRAECSERESPAVPNLRIDT